MSERQKARVKKIKESLKEPEEYEIPATVLDFCKLISFEPDPWQADLLNELANDRKPVNILANCSRQTHGA